jgi:hypothetical protein
LAKLVEGKMKPCSLAAILMMSTLLLLSHAASAGSLHAAAFRGDAGAIREHLALGADVNERDSSGVAPLHYAARMGHTDIIGILVSNGADPDIVSAEGGNTPLHLAAWAGQYGAAGLLLGNGASIDKTNERMETPLHWAVENGRTQTVALLLSRGADIEACDGGGAAPLRRAVTCGYCPIVDILLARGAEPGSKDLKGVSPLRTALERGYVRIARRLRSAGAPFDSKEDLARFVQGQLWLRGYGIDEADGIVGPETVNAIKAFERHAGLGVSGLLTEALADRLTSTGEIGPYLNGETGTVTNIFTGWYELAYSYGWEPGLLWSRAEFVEEGLSGIDAGFRGAMKYSGHVRFGRLEIDGTVWVVPNGWVIAHGSKVILRSAD